LSEGDEIALPGGNVGGAVRVGDTVRRPTGPWTPAVHALMAHVGARIPHVPEVLGFDDQGREVLTFLPGEVIDVETQALTDAQLEALVSWTHDFHRAVADFDHDGPWRFVPGPAPTLIGHNDIAPYNACFAADELTGVFDWDFAGPSSPLNELAFIAWNGVPLTRDVGTRESARRLALIADAYSGVRPQEVIEQVPARIQQMFVGITSGVAAGDPGMIRLVQLGEPQRSQRTLAELITRIPAIRGAMG
jgi:hypothetical protein